MNALPIGEEVVKEHEDDGYTRAIPLLASQPKSDAVGTTPTIATTLMVFAAFCLALWILFDDSVLYMRW
jgi:hypothetical protein